MPDPGPSPGLTHFILVPHARGGLAPNKRACAAKPALSPPGVPLTRACRPGWGVGVARDKYEYGGANWEKNMPMRAKQILAIIYRLGTTAIKVGQALSVREDLIPAPYVAELRELQDRVPPFPTPLARKVMEEQLAKSANKGGLSSVFQQLSPLPVAAASIAQVYRAKLYDGTDVAVKVQRPGILQDIALDLHMCRLIAPIYKQVFKLNSDVEGLVDEWGKGFVNELDVSAPNPNSKTLNRVGQGARS